MTKTMRCLLGVAVGVCFSLQAEEKTMIDFFRPFETSAPLQSENIWGDVVPRDVTNGLEDPALKKWCYWDGSIIKDDVGIYHLYACRWSQGLSHGAGWNTDSKGVHAVSDSLYGPYKDQGLTWPFWKGGFGANVIGLRMHDGRYALINSEVVPGQVFVSDGPNGPWELLGDFKIDPNGYYPGWARYNELDDGAMRAGVVGHLSNVMIILRPDNRYMMLARHCVTMISDDGILGPYKMMSDKAWLGVDGLPQFKMEDPTVWYNDGLYHIVVNHHLTDTTYHLTSEDGIHNWKNRGLAFQKGAGVFRHPDGTVEDWAMVQRPTVYIEDNVVKAFNFSVIDVRKGADKPNDRHGSKVIVVPFDGAGFKAHIKKVVDDERRQNDATPPPAPWKSVDIGQVPCAGNSGYDEVVKTIRVRASGNALDGKQDACRFVYQKMSGDCSAKVMVLSQEISGGPAQGGLMVRKTLAADSVSATATISTEEGFQLNTRSLDGALSKTISSLDIKAPYWLRLEKRNNNITCYVSPSDRLNWQESGEIKLDLGNEFYVGMAATSTSAQSTLSRFKAADVHSYGHPVKDGLVRHTFPDTIPACGIVDFEVELESAQALDIWVELQNVETLEKYKVLRQRFWKSGTSKITYNAGTPLDPNASYWFVIKAIPMHFHDSEHVDSAFKKVFVEKQDVQ